MMTTAKPALPLLPVFLNSVDWISDRLGRSVPQIVDLDRLQQSPTGSFGHAIADFLRQNQLDPFITGARRKQLHDCVHVLTGYGADPIGELEVQAFMLGAKFHPFHLLISGGLLRIAHHHGISFPLTHADIRQRLWTAYQRGQSSQFDPDTWRPEDLWHDPLPQVRTMFGV